MYVPLLPSITLAGPKISNQLTYLYSFLLQSFILFRLIMSPTFETLSPEIIMLVLENLPDSATLLAAILSCYHVRNTANPYIPPVPKSIAISQILTLLDDSYALYEIL